MSDDVDFDAEGGKGLGEFVREIPHASLHGGKFASDEAEFHLQKFRRRNRVVVNVRQAPLRLTVLYRASESSTVARG